MSENKEKDALRGASMLVGLVAFAVLMVSVGVYLASIWSSGQLAHSLVQTAVVLVITAGLFGAGSALLWQSARRR